MNLYQPVYSITIPDFGTIDFRNLQLEKDIVVIHDWVNRDYAQYWGMKGNFLEEVRLEYEKITRESDVFIGLVNGEISFLLERYNPKKDIIGSYYPVKDGDCGIHIIVAPATNSVHNFTWHIFSSIMKFIFRDLTIERIVVEPDIRNKKMFDICHRVGFENANIVHLPKKTALLAFCTREQFIKKIYSFKFNYSEMNNENQLETPERAITHIQPEVWEKANRLLLKKTICEFSHERLIKPILEYDNQYSLVSDDETIKYIFNAHELAMHHLNIELDSISKYKDEDVIPLDVVDFILEFKTNLGISEQLLPSYIEEIVSTLYGSCYKLLKENSTSKSLANSDFQTIEQAMIEGHPAFVANNGRIGYNSIDYKFYSPETGSPFKLLWLAGHRDRTVYAGTKKLDYDTLIQKELGYQTITKFNAIISEKGQNPNDYFFIPVHPWQWFNKLANLFSTEIAKQKLICVGYGPDLYQAQQSIRTLFNLSNPKKLYTKTSLSILNMGFMRGLPAFYLETAPEMAEWLDQLLSNDQYLQKVRFEMLGEVASVSYKNPYFESFGKHNIYNKMIASLWRESPVAKIKNDEQLMTMAALLHLDKDGNSLLSEIIKASSLSIDQWLAEYFRIYLSPLLHCFYQYDLVFMPHGENIILGLEDHVPVRSFIKDITEEASILSTDVIIPKNIDRIYAKVPEDKKLLSIFIDIFDGFFRFMCAILVTTEEYSEDRYWELVAECISEYQEQNSHLKSKFKKYDLFTNEFQLSCLNRLQINNNKTMIDLDDPVALLQFQGKLKNPISPYKK
ncbi:GNAT family N-acetyltransferase [Chryseobacterium rhizoplanae]|uniref:GNAT family N-acetyltransferase n=1 Tax=Chryseobacterium rhizoplanae TaxID=1609531 RepID=UPI001CE36366|nr:GNAT family N-acetyltransferase [Chryseobacterium rhizoplanae]UCA61720.1 GNAT family N-acetyltransferase [Chryseobacterium rhizoplanae]